jgi:3-hydroxyacyl-CoA dehydrogenase
MTLRQVLVLGAGTTGRGAVERLATCGAQVTLSRKPSALQSG